MFGAQERTRTSTTLRPLAPEASASASSATWAQPVNAAIIDFLPPPLRLSISPTLSPARQEHPRMLPVLVKSRAKLLRQEGFFALCLAPQGEKDDRKPQQSDDKALGDGTREQGRQHPGVDRMPDEPVWPAANQLVAGLDRDRAAPVRTQRQPRPHGKQQAQNGHDHARQHQHRMVGKNRGPEPPRRPSFPKNQQESGEHRYQVLKPLSRRLPPLGGLAEESHQEPHGCPNRPRAPRKMKGLLRVHSKLRRRCNLSEQDRTSLPSYGIAPEHDPPR